MSHLAVFLPERLHCGHLIKASPEPQCFWRRRDFESWVCDTAVRRITPGVEWKIIQPYCLKANREQKGGEGIGNVTSKVIDEGEGQCEFDLRQPRASSLQRKSRATELRRWEVSHRDRSAAIITQQRWVLNWVISATSSCQLEINAAWLNLRTIRISWKPFLAASIDVWPL